MLDEAQRLMVEMLSASDTKLRGLVATHDDLERQLMSSNSRRMSYGEEDELSKLDARLRAVERQIVEILNLHRR